MTLTRRRFLQCSLTGAAALGATQLGWASRALADMSRVRAGRRLRILVLGGTAFLGPAIVDNALERGHEVTLFNRGKTNPHLYPDLEKIVGDRTVSHDALKGRKWDVVIDTCGYYPRVVREAAAVLAGNIDQYIFISSISVYADFSRKGLNEESPVGTIEDEATETVTGETYGPLKALCEQAAEQAFPGSTCNIRPGLIVGPRDRSDRFTYWPVRIARGGEVLVPDSPQTVTQIIDVRDLGEFVVRCAERKTCGVYNCTSPAGDLTMGEIFETCRKVSGSNASFVYADGDWLAAQGVQPWSDMPVWIPLEGPDAGQPFTDVSRALAAGLVFRPLSETVRGTLDWWATVPSERKGRPLRAGLTAEREAELLELWRARQG